jgi:hypothetical protein
MGPHTLFENFHRVSLSLSLCRCPCLCLVTVSRSSICRLSCLLPKPLTLKPEAKIMKARQDTDMDAPGLHNAVKRETLVHSLHGNKKSK